MWVFPLLAAIVSAAFAALLVRQLVKRRRPYQAVWAVALAMFAAASAVVAVGVAGGWTVAEFKAYWLLGAVLTVPYLAQGEIYLLVRSARVTNVLMFVLFFGTAFALSRVRSAHVLASALRDDLPSGHEAFSADAFALKIARLYSYPAFAVLVLGTLWSAWRMRGRREMRDRFLGTLAIAVGATIVAAGSAFAAAGNATGFSLTLTAGIAAMFWGFLRASRATQPLAPSSGDPASS
jgi:hypothetical protein